MEESKNGIKAFYAETQPGWRNWLAENHDKETRIWLILYKKDTKAFSITHSEAVDEALCFGWIDSLTIKRDNESRYQLFSRRNPKGNWSAVNKDKALKMIENGLMHESGMKCIRIAKANGMWDALNDVENLIVPNDLEEGFKTNKISKENWESFPKSSKKAILKWISEAKRPETRERRVAETIEMATLNKRVK